MTGAAENSLNAPHSTTAKWETRANVGEVILIPEGYELSSTKLFEMAAREIKDAHRLNIILCLEFWEIPLRYPEVDCGFRRTGTGAYLEMKRFYLGKCE